MKYILRIPEPCNEDWNTMTPTQKGKFCDVCNKDVIDFTKTSKFALARRIDTKQTICGRFKANQINVEMDSLAGFKVSKMGAIFGLSALFAITTPVIAQGNVVITKTQTDSVTYTSVLKNNIHNKLTKSVFVTGVVYDEMGEIGDINVKIKNTTIETVTDFDGKFSLEIPNDVDMSSITLVFSHVSYEIQEVKVNDVNKTVKVTLNSEEMWLGEVVIVKQNIFQRIGNLFRKKKTCKTNEDTLNSKKQ